MANDLKNMKYTDKINVKKLNDLVHSTAELSLVPGTVNGVAYNTYKFDTLQIVSPFSKEIVNAEELYKCLKDHYENN